MLAPLPDYAEAVVCDEKQVQARINEMARQIARDYKTVMLPGEQLMLICILKGSYIFTADLSRALSQMGCENYVEFMCVSSYGKGAESSGEVRMLLDLRNPINGQHVLIVEDIVDTARTMHFLIGLLNQRNPKSLKVCTLLDKPSRRVMKDVKVQYVGFEIPDKFVIGYGMDYAERYRNIGGVYVLKKSEYDGSKQALEKHQETTKNRLKPTINVKAKL